MTYTIRENDFGYFELEVTNEDGSRQVLVSSTHPQPLEEFAKEHAMEPAPRTSVE
jgi:hypothetical protein